MSRVAITGTGTFAPPGVISNDELAASFNAYVEQHNREHADAIARGERTKLEPSTAEFIFKASGIRRRHVTDREGILDRASLMVLRAVYREQLGAVDFAHRTGDGFVNAGIQ